MARCWASLYTARAVAYRRARAATRGGAMAVVVQEMVPARAAGVFMTLNPANGDRSTVVCEAVWGLGEPLVSGEVTPDRFVIDKISGEIVRREIADKPTRTDAHRRRPGTVVAEVAPDDRDAPLPRPTPSSPSCSRVAPARRARRRARRRTASSPSPTADRRTSTCSSPARDGLEPPAPRSATGGTRAGIALVRRPRHPHPLVPAGSTGHGG